MRCTDKVLPGLMAIWSTAACEKWDPGRGTLGDCGQRGCAGLSLLRPVVLPVTVTAL